MSARRWPSRYPFLVFLAVITLGRAALWPQEFGLRADVSLPVGGSGSIFSAAPGVEAAFGLPLLPSGLIRASAVAGYRLQGVRVLEENLSIAGGGLSLSAAYPILKILKAGFIIEGGAYAAIVESGELLSAAPWLDASAGIELALFPRLSFDVGAGWRRYWNMADTIVVSAGARLRTDPAARARSTGPHPLIELERDAGRLVIGSTELKPVYPVFYGWYDRNPLGSIRIENSGASPVEKLMVTFDVRQYMDTPRVIPVPKALGPGEGLELPLFAVFSRRILEESEGAKVAANLQFQYETQGRSRTSSASITLEILNRNALTWDDDRKAAAFVTAKDPVVMEFARNAVAAASSLPESQRFGRDLLLSVAMYEALRIHGMSYVVDPASSYADLSAKGGGVVDYLQFPRQTLQFKSGDCDDLSVLYCALLESVGVETAFVTVPGHIFAALPAADASRSASASGRRWMPVELTMTRSPFVDARAKGFDLWGKGGESSRLLPVREAWKEYPAVAFSEASRLDPLPQAKLAEAIGASLAALIREDLGYRLAGLDPASRDPRVQNKIGIAYAQSGSYREARAAFAKALAQGDYAPALVNLGHLGMLEGDPKGALAFYARASAASPGNAAALAGRASALTALGDRAGADALLAAAGAGKAAPAGGNQPGARGAYEGGPSGGTAWEEE